MDRSIVVVDDEQGVLDVLCDLLEMEGYQPICLSGPDEVESAAREATPCLFMIDIMLPGISGIELAAQLRESGFPTLLWWPCLPRSSWSRPRSKPTSSRTSSPNPSSSIGF